MLHLVYSNRFEQLADALVAALAEARRSGREDALSDAHVLVPNPRVASWLKLAVARRTGVAAAIAFPFVEGFFAGRLSRAPGDLRALDRARLQSLVFGALCDRELLADPALAPVRGYLDEAGSDDGALALRRLQLADHIAGLFLDYAVWRPELAAAWDRDRPGPGAGDHAEIEAWQRRLWRAVFGAGGALATVRADTGTTWIPIARVYEHVAPTDLDLPPVVHVIGFSHLSPGYQALLARTAEACELHVYALNPCMEFWEDLPSGWESRVQRRRLARRGQAPADDGSYADGDPPALALWGRPGRESVRMLNELSNCDFEPRFVDPDPDAAGPRKTALASLQRDILVRAPERDRPDPGLAAGDDSIRVLACPSVRRELEIIGNEIWDLMARDPTLRLNDIAILVARSGQDAYQAQVGSVFHELGRLPYHAVDLPLSAESRVAEALELVLELPLGRFTRPELLRVLTHPAVLARYPEVEANDWIGWVDRLGVAHGADRADHEGTYIDGDVFTWEQAIRRLALGAFMAGERSGDERAVRITDTPYVPEELSEDDLPSAARMALLARSLIEDARHARAAEMPLASWRRFFDALATSYLAPTSDADDRNLGRCRDALASLEDADLDGRPVGYRVACELARRALRSMRASRGELFADGVHVAPLSPMRPLPFRVVFVAGLGQGQFPGPQADSPLDLRAAQPRRGDVSGQEQDRYLFLETLLSARDRLYVSYVARDEESGEELGPSSVVAELVDIVNRGYRADGAPPLVVRHPLRSFDPRYAPSAFAAAGLPRPEAPLPQVSAAATSQAGALALRRHLERHLGGRGVPVPAADDLRDALDAPAWAPVKARLRIDEPAAELPDDDDATADPSLSTATVRRFLDDPLQAWAKTVLRMRDDDFDELVSVEDEPLATSAAGRADILRGAMADFLSGDDRGAGALRRAYEARVRAAARAGRAPVGLFSEVEREQHAARLEGWRENLAALCSHGIPRAAPLHLGSAREHARVDAIRPPIVLGVALPARDGSPERREVELYGATHLVGDRDFGVLVLDHADRPRDHLFLRGLVDHAVLAAAGVGAAEPRTFVHLTWGACGHYRLGAMSANEARAYLSGLAQELLGSAHEYLLPAREVLAYWRNPEKRPLRDRILAARDRGRKQSDFDPIRRLGRFAPPADAEAIVRRRFEPLLSRVEPLS